MYNVVFFAILAAVILAIDISDRNIRFVVVSLIILVGTAITVFSLLGQKLYFIKSKRVNIKGVRGSGSNLGTTSSGSVTSEEVLWLRRKVEDLTDTIEVLRKELKKWKKVGQRTEGSMPKSKDSTPLGNSMEESSISTSSYSTKQEPV